jgi:tRNA pseudouridine38-40 synthase
VNLKIIVAYDGTHYFGWQKTGVGPSIEAELEKAIRQILQEAIVLQAASRTDRGVHALGQVVNFHTVRHVSDLPKLVRGINALLPSDIVVSSIQEVPLGFHPTLHVQSKIYTYEICCGAVQLPRHRLYSWHFPYALNLTLMQKASQFLVGKHDFSAFCNHKKGEVYQDHIRTVESIETLELDSHRLHFTICGNHFLYKMVRNLVGTLAYVGCGKLPLSEIPEILERKDRKRAGMTAPAHGLTLERVVYGDSTLHPIPCK